MSSAILNWLQLDRRGSSRLYDQISAQIRRAILDGSLQPGAGLPASRALAVDLGVSRTTTVRAYEQLLAEGFIVSRRGSGTCVVDGLSETALNSTATAPQNGVARAEYRSRSLYQLYGISNCTGFAFRPGLPALDAFPRLVWSRLLSRASLQKDYSLLDYDHIGGYAPLRAALASYLRGSRGLDCHADQIIVINSVRAAVAAVSNILLPQRTTVAVEDPGYSDPRPVLSAAGHSLCPVPVDDAGLMVDRLLRASRPISAVYLTPTHHWPTGVTLTAERRITLMNWARDNSAWILEDDYDSEFRFGCPPLGTMHALCPDRVIFLGTFAKTFAPSIRTAYLVIPYDRIEDFRKHCFDWGVEPSLHVQAALAELISEGHFTRHITRTRKLYAARRAALIEAIENTFDDRVKINAPPCGLQLTVQLPDHLSATDVAKRADAAGLIVRPLDDSYIRYRPQGQFLHLGFAAVPEEEIAPAVDTLGAVLHPLL